MGSMVAAVASYLSAKCRGGEWLVRMEDVDPQRNIPGCAAEILLTLEAFGFEWDGEVLYQSSRADAYRAALSKLVENKSVFACSCSRREISDGAGRAAEGEIPYPGTCRGGPKRPGVATSSRLRVDDRAIVFRDRFQGEQVQHVRSEIGDFVLRRADGVFTYQLAVVVDDAAQSITEVIRGADLLTSTGRQIFLQNELGYPLVEYGHLPLVTNANGEKLSKQTMAAPLQREKAACQLTQALRILGQDIDPEMRGANVREVWAWTLANWCEEKIPRRVMA